MIVKVWDLRASGLCAVEGILNIPFLFAPFPSPIKRRVKTWGDKDDGSKIVIAGKEVDGWWVIEKLRDSWNSGLQWRITEAVGRQTRVSPKSSRIGGSRPLWKWGSGGVESEKIRLKSVWGTVRSPPYLCNVVVLSPSHQQISGLSSRLSPCEDQMKGLWMLAQQASQRKGASYSWQAETFHLPKRSSSLYSKKTGFTTALQEIKRWLHERLESPREKPHKHGNLEVLQ